MKDIRDIFFSSIAKFFKKDKKLKILTNDADVFALQKLRGHKRFIDVGVAEQNLINISAGLSKDNFKSIVYGFCTFLTFRCYEQIRFNIASMKSNVKIVGIGPGFSFPNDGPTHHGIHDLYVMYLIPEMEIINIGDNSLANIVGKRLFQIKGPTYIRIDKGNLELNKKIKYNLKKGFTYLESQKRKKNLIITTGYFCKQSLEVAKNIKNTSVINFFRFKNFDKKSFIKECLKYKKIFVYDESTIDGGITNIILKLIKDHCDIKKVKIMCCPDGQLFRYSQNRERIHKLLKIDKKSLEKFIKKYS